MPEVQAEPVEAARWGWREGEEVVRDKAFKLQVCIAGVAAVVGWPVDRYQMGTGL